MKIGSSVGGYTIETKLAQGGMGIVWKGRGQDGKVVVLKSIRVQEGASDVAAELTERLRREAEILAKVRHEHVVPFVESFEEGGEVFLVMEHVEGVSFDRVVGVNGALPLTDQILVLTQVASALEHAHGLGVTHRDLKPANVMVAKGPSARVLDFGLARVLDSTRLTATGIVMGTVAYMAPEQARGAFVDNRADIFSLGMMLARVLDLAQPFHAGTMSDTYLRLMSPDPIALDDWLPDDVRDGLLQMVAKDPEDRIATAAEALVFLDALLREGQVLADRIDRARRAPLAARPTAPRLPSLARPTLQAALTSLRGRTDAGRGGTLLLLGHPGGGKSHSLRAARDQLAMATEGVEVYAFASGALVHLIPLQHLTRCNQMETRPLQPSELEESGSPTATLLDNSADLSRLVPRFLDAVAASARLGPCTLLLDDVHHARPAELEWIGRLVELTHELPLLLILAGDVAPEGAGPDGAPAYAEFLARMASASDIVRVMLGGFDSAALRSALIAERVPEDVATAVSRLSGGNAGVTNHLLREWHRGAEISDAAVTAPVRLGVQLRSRWSLLDPDSQGIVRTLLAAKGELRLEDLQSKSGLARLVLRSRLRELERNHGWVSVADDVVVVTQPFLATVLPRDSN